MYHHILIATDGSELSGRAVKHGVELAKSAQANVTFLTVTEPLASLGDRGHMFEGVSDDMRRRALDYIYQPARDALAEAKRQADEMGVLCKVEEVEDTHPYKAILEAANAHGCDLIVMASHGRSGVARVLLGSEAAKVLTHTHIPVLIYR